MPFVNIKGIGEVEVEEAPEHIPGKVQIGSKSVKINRELYLWLWANVHATPDGQARLGKLV